MSGTLFLLFALASGSFDGLSRTFFWFGLNGLNPLEYPGRTALIGTNSVGLIAACAALAAVFLLSVLAGERLAGLPRRQRPSAVFCANDLVALGLLQQVVSTGQRVPEDLAIVGYDDIAFAAGAAVPLTSVRQPRQSLGRAAAELLIDEVNNPDHQHRQVEFTPELIARTSTLG